jgi:hypothetical protein
MKLLHLLLLSFPLLFVGCATPIQYFNVKPAAGQKFVRPPTNQAVFGIQEIKSGIHNEVLFEPTAGNTLFNGMAVFWIYVKNVDRVPFRFGATSVRVEDKNGKPVEVLTLDAISNRLRANKSKQEWAFILASSFLSALEAAPYARTQQTGVFSGYSSDGSYVSGTTVSTTKNTTVEYLSQQRNTDRISTFSTSMNDAYGRAQANLQRLALNEVEVGTGEVLQGIVAVRLPPGFSLPNRYRFVLNISGNTFTHDFPIGSSK